MNFSEVKSITIPEGNVVKIESGGITLCKISTELVCNPVLSIQAYKGYVENKMTVEANISGISNSLINNANGFKAFIIYIKASKISDPYTLKATTSGRVLLKFKEFIGDTVTGAYIRSSATNNTSTSSVDYYYRAYINYTDLGGNTKILYSNPIKAKYSTVASI